MRSGVIADNTVIIERLIEEVFSQQDLAALPELVAADVVDHQAIIFAQPGRPGGVAAGVGALVEAFPDLSIEIGELLPAGDRVVARLTLAGTNAGGYRGLPAPTNRHAQWEAIAIFRIAGGKIAEIHGCADRLGLLTQLGILPDIG
jgi:ketosteroid isomerase-like protein